MSNELNNTTDFVWSNFQRLFPDRAEHVLSYERSGSKMITLHMDDGLNLSFLYYSPVNWNFGTKPWRMRPSNNGEREGQEG